MDKKARKPFSGHSVCSLYQFAASLQIARLEPCQSSTCMSIEYVYEGASECINGGTSAEICVSCQGSWYLNLRVGTLGCFVCVVRSHTHVCFSFYVRNHLFVGFDSACRECGTAFTIIPKPCRRLGMVLSRSRKQGRLRERMMTKMLLRRAKQDGHIKILTIRRTAMRMGSVRVS